jgi:hypothetical protein
MDKVPRFLADNTVWRLGRWMRLLGYDVELSRFSARQIVDLPEENRGHRVLIGRCPGRSGAAAPAPHERFVHIESPHLCDQLEQVVRAWPQDFKSTFLSRCQHCNHLLEASCAYETLPEAAREKVPPKARFWRDFFRRCVGCGRVYWEGTHVERMRCFLRDSVGLDV